MRKCRGAAVLIDYKYRRCNPQPPGNAQNGWFSGHINFYRLPVQNFGNRLF